MGLGDLTPEEEEEQRLRSRGTFQTSVIPAAQQSPLALLQAQPGQVGGVNMMPPPLPASIAALPDAAPAPAVESEDARVARRKAELEQTMGTGPQAEPGPADMPAAPVPTPIPMPAPASKAAKSAGGGGGGGGGGAPGSVPGHMTKEEMLAKGDQQIAQEAEGSAIKAEGENKAQIAGATHERDVAEQKALVEHQASVKQRMDAATSYLQKKQDERANMKIRDIFDGRPGVQIASALMAGLGQFASGVTGQANGALSVLNENAKAFREKEMIRLDQAEKGVTDAKERMDIVRMGAAAEEAGLWKRLGAERAANLSRFGADQARIEADKTYQHTQVMQAQSEREWQTMLHNRGQQEILQGAQISRIRSENATDAANRGKTAAEIRHLDAESGKLNAEAAGGGPLGSSGGRAASKMIDLGLSGAQQADDLDVINREMAKAKNGIVLTADERNAMQSKATRLHAAAHDTSNTGAFVTNTLRGFKLAPRSEIEDLTPGQQAYVQSVRLMSEKAAALIEKDKDGKERVQQLLDPTAGGISDAASRDRTEKLRTLGYVTNALAGKYGQQAQQAAAEARAAGVGLDQMIQLGRGIAKTAGVDTAQPAARGGGEPARAAAPTGDSSPNIDAVKEFIRNNPRDPRIPAAMKKLREMGAL